MLSQRKGLLGARFSGKLPRAAGARYEKYCDALESRLEGVWSNPGKDLDKQAPMRGYWQTFMAIQQGTTDAAMLTLHIAFEEWRIGLFSPELGAGQKVSAASIERALQAIMAGSEHE